MNTTPMTQSEMMNAFGPAVAYAGKIYAKKTKVFARPAVEGEVVVTITSDGKETQNTAKAGDFVVENQTAAKEQYIVAGSTFQKRYMPLTETTPSATGFSEYKAVGKCLGIVYKGTVNTENLSLESKEIMFISSWKEEMVLKPGDMLVAPLPDTESLYRIAAKEFAETYELEA